MNLPDLFEEIEDNRHDINKVYDLADIIFLALASILSGANGWKDMEIFGKSKLDWLRQFRPFENGIPTRHSIGRIIRTLDTDTLMSCFAIWVNEQRTKNGKEHIAFDGKSLRGSAKPEHAKMVHLMGAMVVDSGLLLFQSACKDKDNEITTLRSMLEVMPVKGAVLSADAMHCQKETAKLVIEKEADYMLQVKNNQKTLKQEIHAYFHKVERDTPTLFDQRVISETDGEHGRLVEPRFRS